jgi:hypothetical protein
MTADFDPIQSAAQQGVAAVLDQLASQLRERQQYHELFEARKMQVRRELGLPLQYSETPDALDETRRNRLEEGLIEACREVGTLLMQAGRIREGWMYLRPVGDKSLAVQELARIEATPENTEELVEVCLHEGVDVKRGFQLVLDQYGTCNAITHYESAVGRHPRPDQQAAAELLVRHVHAELTKSVVADMGRQEGTPPREKTLRELVADRDWLFGEYSYHIDTTHLASTVRSSRILEDAEPLRLALDLTEYGRRLAQQFQYKGEEPFQDIYPSHALYLGALLGQDIDAALQYFRQKAETLSEEEHGSLPTETYVQLLERVGRYREAIDALLRYGAQGDRGKQIIPLLHQLCGKLGDFQPAIEFCRRQGDVLGYATALASSLAPGDSGTR